MSLGVFGVRSSFNNNNNSGRLDFREFLIMVEEVRKVTRWSVEKGLRAVSARGRAGRKLGFGINPALNKYG
jgi:hypothetical protein